MIQFYAPKKRVKKMFDIHFYGTSYSGEVAYTWYWSNDKNCMQYGVSVNGWLIRVDL